MHEDQATDPIEENLSRAFAVGGQGPELPDAVRAALGAHRSQRRRQLAGASALVVVIAVSGTIWMTMSGGPGAINRVGPGIPRNPGQRPLIVRASGCDDATVLGLMRCNRGFEDLDGREIALSEDWDLGWVGSTPALLPGEM